MPEARIVEFCTRWGVKELALFGSAIRDDFGPGSDVDVLIDFLPGHSLTFENTPLILDELRALFGRDVDLVEKNRIRNRFRREAIMAAHRVIYAA